MSLWSPITREQAAAKYGASTNGVWANALVCCTMFKVPSEIGANWINTATGKPTDRIYVNKDMVDPLMDALFNVRNRGLLGELKTFDGCFMQRDVRGEPGKVSWHAWAMAIDINAKWNSLGEVGDNSSALLACFKDVGFILGASFQRMDFMHVQLGID